MLPLAALAVPAAPTLHTLRQPDGSTIFARQVGDERLHYWVTIDGRIVTRDPRSGAWVGSVRPSAVGTRALDAPFGKTVPATGTGHIPLLCVNFVDTTTSFTPGALGNSLFSGAKSMAAYYKENSYSKFTVDAGPSGVGGWYTATNNHDYYGSNDSSGNDVHPAELVIEAVRAADAAGFNFAPYDQDGDGYVDVVAIAHQGTDEAETGNATDIWSHSWDLNSAQAYGDGTGEVVTNDGVKVNAYIIQPEKTSTDTLTTIGVFCHEYGHALGLSDFYDYGYDSEGLGDWTLMAGGSWGGNNGDTPAHIDAWGKIFLGWVTPTVARHQTGVSVPAVESNPTIYKIAATGPTGKEYFLIENRQRTGFDVSLPGAGLLVYHVDDSQTSNDNQWYPGLPAGLHYWVALEQADGRYDLERNANGGDAGDPFPGTSGNRAFDATSSPQCQLYDGTASPLVVRNISNSGSTMTIDILDVSAPQPPKTVAASDTPNDDGGSVTFTWSKSPDDGKGANDVIGYDVQRATAAAGPFTSLTPTILPAGTTTYIDTAVVNYTSYWYRVVVHDGANTTDSRIAGPAIPRNDGAPPQVTQLVASDAPGDDGGVVALRWNGYVAPADFRQFNVYRGTSAFTLTTATGVTKIATLTDPSTLAFNDTTAVNGVQYWYAVTGVDNVSDAISPNGNENTKVAAVGPVVASPNFTFTYPLGTSMIAVGATPQSTDMATILGVSPATLQLARWDPVAGAYHTYQANPADPLLQQALGRGFWLSLPSTLTVDVAGQAAPAEPVSIPFVAGWNMLGNPYTVDASLSGAQVTVGTKTYTLAEAAALNICRDYCWAYDPYVHSYKLVSSTIGFADRFVRKGRGVFFRGLSAGNLVLARPAGAADAATPAAEVIQPDWAIRLVASCAAGADTDNFVGVASNCGALNSIAGPPAMGVDLYFDNGGVHSAGAFTAPGDATATCKVSVVAQSAGPVTISWPDLSSLPGDVRPVLVDSATGKRVYLRTSTSYTFDAAPGVVRQLQLLLSRDGAGALAVKSLSATSAGAGAQIVFALSADAQASVEILNVAGRVVRRLTPVQASAAEVVTLSWDGRSDSGTAVPAGRYLVRVSAAAEDGQAVSAAGAVSLKR
jgi:immune inhibitor A